MQGEGGEDREQEGVTEGKGSESTPDNFALENFADKDHDKVFLVCNEVICLQVVGMDKIFLDENGLHS